MKLAQIKLAGFKSFVDPTTINIKGQLVGIVGPNGCGKSNVIDAVRWVLGESSAKQLRGESMQDVIFNGSVNRKAVSRASVELIFDNQQKLLSNAWNAYSEISIKRILTRSGESIYYINNQSVRKKDITELFLGTGVGTKGYAVIEQGMISRIIDAKPEDLRMYLEEAAGVSKYREKRKETISRLLYTKENLIRLDDIKFQLEESIEHLSIQAMSARRYQDLKTKLVNLQLTHLLVKIDKTRLSLSEINEAMSDLQKNLASLATIFGTHNDELNELSQKKAIEEYQLQLLNEEFNQLRLNITRLDERKKNNQQAIQKITREKEQLDIQIPQIKTQIELLKDAISDNNSQLTENEVKRLDKELELTTITEYFESVDSDYQASLFKVSDLSNKLVEKKHVIDLLKNTFVHKQNQVANLEQRLSGMDSTVNSPEINYSLIADEISELKISIELLNDELGQKKDTKQKLEQQKLEQQNTINQLKQQTSGLNSKIATLEELISRAQNVDNVKEFLVNPGKPLSSGMSVKQGYEVAVEVAIGNILSGISVKSLDSLLKLPVHKLVLWFGGTDICVTINPKSLASVVEGSDYPGLITLLNDYIIAADYPEALQLLKDGNTNIVTLDGHYLTNSYVIFNAHHGNSHVLEHQNELKGLHNNLAELSISLGSLEIKQQQTVDNIHNLELEITSQIQQLSSLNNKTHNLQVEYTRQEQIHLHNVMLINKMNQEKEQLVQEIAMLNTEITNLEVQLNQESGLLDGISNEHNLAKSAHQELYNNHSLAKIRVQDIEALVKELHSEKQLLQQRLNSSTLLMVEKESALSSIYTRLEALGVEIKDLHNNDEEVEINLLQDEINLVVEKIEQQKIVCQGLLDKQNQIQQRLSQQTIDKTALEDKLNTLRLKQQEHMLSIQNLQANITDLEVGEYVADELLQQNKLSIGQIEEELKSLRYQIEELGLVNLKAIEDLAESQQKYDNLVLQINDLRDANTALETAIGQIDGESRKLLNDTYTRVNESFAHYFKILFGGGNARLQLTEDDILVAGVQIYAEPLGKKNTTLHLLSGGEKALTAMSLVFALFSLNPAPFCLLDEVDAPLDDANTVRFCKLVKQLSDNTQFVYISHNRLTMEIANQLVGVTMQEKGVSTTVSVSLVDAIKNAS
jgi:chromosome segregation protein